MSLCFSLGPSFCFFCIFSNIVWLHKGQPGAAATFPFSFRFTGWGEGGGPTVMVVDREVNEQAFWSQLSVGEQSSEWQMLDRCGCNTIIHRFWRGPICPSIMRVSRHLDIFATAGWYSGHNYYRWAYCQSPKVPVECLLVSSTNDRICDLLNGCCCCDCLLLWNVCFTNTFSGEQSSHINKVWPCIKIALLGQCLCFFLFSHPLPASNVGFAVYHLTCLQGAALIIAANVMSKVFFLTMRCGLFLFGKVALALALALSCCSVFKKLAMSLLRISKALHLWSPT